MKMIHPVKVQNKEPREIGREIAQLRYDAIEGIIDELAKDLDRQRKKDLEAGKIQLAQVGQEMVDRLHYAKNAINKAWRISEPYMQPLIPPKIYNK